MQDAELADIAKAINRWLSYQLLCGRDALLSEAYLGHPLAEYLIQHHSGQFEAEVNHPVLNKPRPGRPRQIDYVLRTKNAASIEVAMECKWVSTTSYDKQRILNDVLRLECVRVSDRHVKRFLVVAGLKDNFDKNFKMLRIRTKKKNKKKLLVDFTKGFLPFSRNNPIVVRPANAKGPLRNYYRIFEASFNASIPKSFKTELVGRRTADDIDVCVWQISSVSNRHTFSPSEAWK